MKKVIDGALYNTTTAKLLAENSRNIGELNFAHEELYITKSGKYFIYGDGGPASRYAKSIGQNTWSGGEHIEPLSVASAMEWAEEYLPADEYIAVFGEPIEATECKAVINLTLPIDIKRKLERLKSETGRSISAIISELVENI